MGIFGSIGKVLAGKPVYEPTKQNDQLPDDGQSLPPQSQQVSGALPVIRFGRIECQVSGQRLDVYADASNDSEVAMLLDWVTLCGVKRQVDMQLRPGEVRQLLIYSGQLMGNQPSGYATVQYRPAPDGDYLVDYHEIRSEQDGAMGYRITELLQRGPVKDI